MPQPLRLFYNETPNLTSLQFYPLSPMESLHLPFAIALASISASSLGLLGFSWFRSRSRDSKVSLPTAADEPLSTSHEVNDDAEVDPFDVTKPEDFVDGFALEEDAFWAKMRLRKMGISLVLAIIVAANGALLGWLLAAGKDTKAAYQATFLELFASIYILVISLISIFQTEVKPHWNLTVHLTTLSSISFFLFATRIVLPGPHHKAFHLSLQSSTIRTCGYLNAVPYLLVAFLAGTARRSPDLHYPPELAYSSEVAHQEGFPASNVCGIVTKSLFSFIFFDYITPVVFRGYGRTLNVQDLPLLPSRSRATIVFSRMREATKRARLSERWRSQPGSGWELMRRLLRLNARPYLIQAVLAVISSILYYGPAFFLQRLVQFLEKADSREHMDRSWGWIYCAGLFLSNAISYLIAGQLWMVSTTTLQVNLRIQLNTILFAKTLVRKDVSSTAGPSMSTTHLSSAGAQVAHQGSPTPSASSSVSDLTSTAASTEVPTGSIPKHEERIPDEDDFSGKAQVMTLMTTDVDRVAEFSTHFSSLIDAPMEILIGSIFLYHLLGASSFVGLAVTCLFLPLNHYGSKVVFRAQDALMKTRDERVSLMNEILGGMRMLKFMAWERSYEARVLRVRDKELHYQRRNFFIETFFNTVWAASPVLVTVVAFWHYAVVRGIPLTPSVAFTSLSVFNELKFALNALPETFISMLQSFVSVRRIEKYLNLAEVKPVKPLELSPLRLSTFSTEEELPIVLNNATITWPQDQSRYPQWIESSSSSSPPSAVSTPGLKFVLLDLTLNFPKGELSLICGKLGSGKTLLLLGLLGEADLLGGQIICPRSPPDVIAKSAELRSIPDVEWIVPGVCAYVPQTAWLQNATIRDNILFNLPYNEQRYRATVEACCLLTDFEILEDGDHSEIGERGVTLSGGQKARVSLARAIYSRASILLLDDVLSAVDAHTASNIYENALKGPLTKNRTVILVSHHVQLTAPGASYIVALDNGQLRYAGDRQGFKSSGVMSSLVQSTALETPIIMMETKQLPPDDLQIGDLQLSPPEGDGERSSDAEVSDTMVNSSEGIDSDTGKQKKPRKLIQEEQRAFGNIRRRIWLTYVSSCGGYVFWLSFAFVLLFASISPVIENGWLKIWSAAYKDPDARSPLWYMSIYAGLTAAGLIIATIRWLVLYQGSIHASRILYQRLLESVLFANIRFHDTTNRGRLLNRFGKDFEGLDSSLATNMGRTLIGSLTVATTFITVAVIGGPWFILAALFIAMFFYRVAVVYSHTSRDLRRLDSVTRSPLYTIYGESIGGATVLRAFGASTKFLREMHQLVNTNNVCYYWMLSVNRWLNIRFNLLSSAIVGLVGVVILWNPKIDAALAGFLLSFVQSVSNSLILMTRRFVGLEQSMVALERVDEYSYLPPEGPEYMEPRPPASWPHDGAIQAENLVVRYAPNLPNVLHGISFEIEPRSKIGILGRTGCGKSTLALSFFRFVQATEGRIVIDGIDISQVGLTDLRSRLTIIPQDPTILSGTLRSTLDVFNQYEDHEIFDALRRVHLIPAEDDVPDDPTMINANVFRNLDSPVAENGENFSSGEKQLLCMARAILKRSKVLFMDEATASVDYATDELISKTIRREFAESTILCIAHRLRTVIDYDKVLILDKGRVVEYDRPSVLLENPDSHFYALCQSTGRAEFRMLKRMADEAAERNRR